MAETENKAPENEQNLLSPHEDIDTDEQTSYGDENRLDLTFDEALDYVGFGFYQFILLQISGSGWLCDGIQLALISFIIPHLTQLWNLTPFIAGLLGSIVFFGMIFGAWFGGMISDMYGRKFVMIVGMFITAFSSLASAFSPDVYWFIAIRFFLGIGLGSTVPTDFSLFMEFVPKKHRGGAMFLINVYWSIGSVIVSILSWWLVPGGYWRWLIAISSIFSFVSLLFRFFIHESPRYLLVKGEDKMAMETLHVVARWNCSLKNLPKFNMTAPHKNLLEKTDSFRNIVSLFSPSLIRTTILLVFIWFCLSYGSWGFSFLLPIVFVKLHSANVFLNQIIIYSMGGIAYIVGALVVDFFPRRYFMGVAFAISGLVVACFVITSNVWFILAVSVVFIFLNAVPWGVSYLYTTEVYPTTLRASGLGVCSAMTRLAGTITPIIGEELLVKGYFIPFLTFSAAFLFAALCSFFLNIETKGKSLKDDVNFNEYTSESKPQNETTKPLI